MNHDEQPDQQADENSGQPAASTSEGASSSADAPEHLTLDDLASQSYLRHIESLKVGAPSKISKAFGSAIELLCDNSEPEAPPKLDITELQPESPDEMKYRMLYLTHQLRVYSREFLQDYVARACAGEFRAKAKKAMDDISDERFSTMVKEFTCAHVYLTALEQADPETSPEWQKDFFGGSLAAVDVLVFGPPAQIMIDRLETLSVVETSRRATSDLCRFFGFGGIGERSWDLVYCHLRNAGSIRRDCFNTALTEQIGTIENELKNL